MWTQNVPAAALVFVRDITITLLETKSDKNQV